MKKQHIILTAVLAVLTVGILGVSAKLLLKQAPPQYRTIAPETKNIEETVRASGPVTAGQSVDLSFPRSGRIKMLSVKVGDTVHAGQVLAELDNATEAAQISQARAALAQRAAGSTPTQIAIMQAAVDAAKADLDKTKSDTNASIATAQSALDTAQNNLKLASGDGQSQIVLQAYQNANTTLQTTVSVVNNALIQADNILGTDSAANANFSSVLSLLDTSKLATAKAQYQTTKTAAADLQLAVSSLSVTDQAATDGVINRALDVLSQSNMLLSSVTDVLRATVGGSSYLPQADLTAKMTIIQQTQSGVQAQRAVVVASQQAITNAKNSLTSYTIAYAKAQQDLANAKASAAGAVAIKQSLYNQAQANLANAKAPVRAVDLGPLYAAVNVAGASYMQTLVTSPIDGVVTKKSADVGAIAVPNAPVLTIINEGTLQTEILVSEADVSKVSVGNHATLTLDAYGPNTTFDAAIVKIDPAQTTMNGVTGYKLTLQFTKADERIKAGMTANASIVIQHKDNALTLPSRSILQKDGKYVVLVLKPGATQPVMQEVQIGVKGDDGSWEVASGLDAKDQIANFGN